MPTVMSWIKRAANRNSLDNRRGSPAEHAPASASDVETRYSNRGELARGGMGAIIKVYDREIRRELVMKVFDPADGNKEPGRIGLFVEEAQITGQLDHPNICPVHDVGSDDAGTRFFTMKMVRGKTLAEIIRDPSHDPANPQSLRVALEVVRKVCDALAFAHAKGVIHRDLKPENIMVGDFGQVYLMDWGVAKLMPQTPAEAPVTLARSGPSAIDEAGAIVGTLMYMAPEQARGDAAAVDERSDVFGLGAILYEVLTQVPPYFSLDVGQLVLQAQSVSWRPPQELVGDGVQLPAALCAICEKAMSPEPAERYGSVLALKAALEAFLSGGLAFPSETISAGLSIMTEGEAGDSAYIIQRGYCRVYKLINGENVGVADLGPGDVFGEAAVFASSPRTATVQAITDVTVQVVRREVFEQDLGLASSIGLFVKAIATRFVATHYELQALKESLATNTASAAAPVSPSTAPAAASGDRASGDLVNAAQSLQALATSPEGVPELLLEALVVGAQELARRRSARAAE